MCDDKIVCFDCYYIRDKWENNEERTVKWFITYQLQLFL
jgi:hypothetical protein